MYLHADKQMEWFEDMMEKSDARVLEIHSCLCTKLQKLDKSFTRSKWFSCCLTGLSMLSLSLRMFTTLKSCFFFLIVWFLILLVCLTFYFWCHRMDIQTLYGAFGCFLHKLHKYPCWSEWTWSWTNSCHCICCKYKGLKSSWIITLLHNMTRFWQFADFDTQYRANWGIYWSRV